MPAFRILYVDDDRDSCEMISLMLRQADESYSVTTVAAAEEALALLENQSFDLFILDFWMPGMSGVELCRYIRQSDQDTPVLLFSGMARPSDRAEAMTAGASEYLVKPNDLDKFEETVKRLLKRKSMPNR